MLLTRVNPEIGYTKWWWVLGGGGVRIISGGLPGKRGRSSPVRQEFFWDRFALWSRRKRRNWFGLQRINCMQENECLREMSESRENYCWQNAWVLFYFDFICENYSNLSRLLREMKYDELYIQLFFEKCVWVNNKIRWIDYQFSVRFLFIFVRDKIFYLSFHTILIMHVHFEMKTLMALQFFKCRICW